MADQKILLGNVRGEQGPAGPNTVSSSTTTSGFENGQVLYNDNGHVGGKKLSAEDVGLTVSSNKQTVNGITTTVNQYGNVVTVVYDGAPTSQLTKGSWQTIATGLPAPAQIQLVHTAVSVFTGVLYTVTVLTSGDFNVYPRTDNISEAIRGTFTYIKQEES